MPTLLQLAGVECPRADGVSLVQLLRAQSQRVRETLHVEHAVCYSKEQAFHALTDGHMKYIWRPESGTEQLFDLEKDGREESELSKTLTAQQTLETWRAQMIKQLAGRPEGFSDGNRLIPGRPYPPIQKARK